jgi:hypothetical protein
MSLFDQARWIVGGFHEAWRVNRECRSFAGALVFDDDLLHYWACDLTGCSTCKEIERLYPGVDLPRRS